MPSFGALDKRLRRDEEALHDYLWHGAKVDEEELFGSLTTDSRDLDAFLGLRGRFSRSVRTLLKTLVTSDKQRYGGSLYGFLFHPYYLAAGVESLRKGDHARVADLLQDEVGSVTIGLCSSAGRFEFVEEWESRKVDFETYLEKLVDFLEGKGVPRARPWGQVVRVAYRYKGALDGATRGQRDLLARAAILGACWATIESDSIQRAISAPPGYPADALVATVSRIAERM